MSRTSMSSVARAVEPAGPGCVSQSMSVFRKELRKAFNRLVPEERAELKRWFRTTCVCRVDQQEMQAVLIALERHDQR